ncbi:hypothetical protein GGS23DRAFT_547513 [Durotheca rogersii]|uniref:uncharacterized protein n=1 Tax=Durotheca rogersii TaxID=419775 RepID=UPI00221F5621|nr:uncharacterized protein GGS23DRAFT_547513 [Durotheca rogersii]KAI5867249.1 hypothetical protein GGS23DRAFT_547513 [Durotheca rogersii]
MRALDQIQHSDATLLPKGPREKLVLLLLLAPPVVASSGRPPRPRETSTFPPPVAGAFPRAPSRRQRYVRGCYS